MRQIEFLANLAALQEPLVLKIELMRFEVLNGTISLTGRVEYCRDMVITFHHLELGIHTRQMLSTSPLRVIKEMKNFLGLQDVDIVGLSKHLIEDTTDAVCNDTKLLKQIASHKLGYTHTITSWYSPTGDFQTNKEELRNMPPIEPSTSKENDVPF